MKLWLKISLICTAVLLLTVSACSVLLLTTSKGIIISQAEDNARAEQANLQRSFEQMMNLYGKGSLGPIEQQSLALYCFKYFKNETAVLISNGETIYSNLVFNPVDYLPLSQINSQQDRTTNIQGVHVIIVGDKITVSSIPAEFEVYYVQDISSAYAKVSLMIWRFGVVSPLCILFGVCLIIVLTKYATRPVSRLSESVKRIARGEYTERACVQSKDEVGELARDFNLMAQAVQEHVEELKEVALRQQLFIGGLTHEFKTPLTSVIGHSETLLYTKMPQEAAETSLLYIHEQCRWLERLTQKLLKLVALQDEIELADEPVAELLQAVGESAAETLAKRGVRLETNCGVETLPMDRDLMLSLLVNLVDNAAKASAAGQAVTLRAYDRTIQVADNGIGMPADEISRITEPFYVVDKSRSRTMGGVGLGLALAKKIADAHGAELVIQSSPGNGTAVKVIFPANKTFTKP